MPITYQIDKAQGVIRTKCCGFVTLEEVMNHFRLLVQDSNCPRQLSVLLDLSESTSVPDSDQLRAVSNQVGQVRNIVQFDACAIVAARDVMFGMARMFAVFAENRFRVTCVFRAVAEAEEWLAAQRVPPPSAKGHARPGAQQAG